MTSAPTFAEAETVSGIPEPVLRQLAIGPLAPDDDDRVPLRTLLGVALIASFEAHGVLPPEKLVAVATEAMHGAQPDGGRVLILSFKEARPVLSWARVTEVLRRYGEANVGAPIRAPHLVVPADALLADLGTGLQQLRAGSARLH